MSNAGNAGVSHSGNPGVSHAGNKAVSDAGSDSQPDAGAPSDAGAGNSEGGRSGADSGGEAGADAMGGSACVATPHACATGSCVPGPCHVGTLSCGDVPTCVDTLVNLPAGTSCGAGSVCSAAGACELVPCVSVPANLPNCVADKPCHIGHCQQNDPVCADLTKLLNFAPAENGSACGVPNRIGVCAQGECVVPHCLANDGPCDIACVNNAGTALPEGARCGENSVCLTGKCTTELAISGVPFTFVPGTSVCGVVAHLTDSNLADTTATLVASINWGDTGPSSTSVGTITGSAGAFTVAASHVYAKSGTYGVSVVVTDVRTGARSEVDFGVSDHIVELPLPAASHPSAIAVAKDGNIWFGVDYGKLGRITPTGADFTSFTVPDAASSVVPGIAAAADGNLWFTLDRANSVGRITPQGVITQFPVPTANAGPGGITAGADGNFWFMENSKVARITPSGAITEFPVGESGGYSSDCLGPDNNVWFTEYIGSKVGRITPQGSLKEWPTPTPNSYPAGITTGSDGNLWFLEVGAYKVVRMTPSGVFTEFPTLREGSVDLSNIVSGPDGNLWVMEYNSNRIARVTTAGVFTHFTIPTDNSQSFFIAASPSALWFTEGFKGKIGRLIP